MSVELREFEAGDADAVHRWFNDRGATEGLLEQRESFCEREAADWVERALDDEGEDRKWAVVVDGASTPSGFVALYGIGRQIAPELGVLIARPRRARAGASAARRSERQPRAPSSSAPTASTRASSPATRPRSAPSSRSASSARE